jgi:hypothetical protein
MLNQCFVIRWCNSIMLHGEERSGEERTASKKNTVWGESRVLWRIPCGVNPEFCVCGKFNYCEWVGSWQKQFNSSKDDYIMHTFREHFCWNNLHHSSVWIEKVEHMEILLVLIVFNRVIKETIINLVKATWTSISSPTCGPSFLQSAPGGRYLDSPEMTKE